MKNKFEKTSNSWCCPYLNVSRNVDWEGEAKEEVCRSRMGNHPALGRRRRHCSGWTVHAPKVSMAGRQGDPVTSGSAAVSAWWRARRGGWRGWSRHWRHGLREDLFTAIPSKSPHISSCKSMLFFFNNLPTSELAQWHEQSTRVVFGSPLGKAQDPLQITGRWPRTITTLAILLHASKPTRWQQPPRVIRNPPARTIPKCHLMLSLKQMNLDALNLT